MTDDTTSGQTDRGPEGDADPATFDPGCAFQEATDLATRFARLGLEAAATPLAWLPGPAREQLRHSASSALHGLAVAPRVVSGVLDELAREVDVPLEESDLGSRRRTEGGQGPDRSGREGG